MIAKITSGNNFYGVLAYCESKEESISVDEKGIQKEPGYERLSVENFENGSNILSKRKSLSDALNQWSNRNNRSEKKVFHASIAMPEGSNCDNETLVSIAKTYLDRMGYKGLPYVIYKHNDTHHQHIHIVTSRIGVDGKVISSSNDFRKNNKVCRDLEKEFGLAEIIGTKQANNNTVTLTPEEPFTYTKKQSFKSNVLQNINYYLHKEKVQDIVQLANKMAEKGIAVVTHDEQTNQPFPRNGLVFYRLSKKGERESRLKGSAFGKEWGSKLFKTLEFNRNKKEIINTTSKPDKNLIVPISFKDKMQIAKKVFNLYTNLYTKSLFTISEISSIAKSMNLDIDIKTNASGFNGFAIKTPDGEIKPSELVYNGIGLSSTFLKDRIVTDTNKEDKIANLVKKNIESFNKINPNGSNNELLNYLNRYGIKIDTGNNSIILSEQNKISGVASLSLVPGLSNIPNESLSIQEHLKLGFAEIKLYEALIKGNTEPLLQLSKYEHNFELTSNDNANLKGLSEFQIYAELQDRVLSAAKEKGNAITNFTQLTNRLNRRGIEIIPTINEKDIIQFTFKDHITGRLYKPANFIGLYGNQKFLNSFSDHITQKQDKLEFIKNIQETQYINTILSKLFIKHENGPIPLNKTELALLLSQPLFAKQAALISQRNAGIQNQANQPNRSKKNITAKGNENTGGVSNNTSFDDMWRTRNQGQ